MALLPTKLVDRGQLARTTPLIRCGKAIISRGYLPRVPVYLDEATFSAFEGLHQFKQ